MSPEQLIKIICKDKDAGYSCDCNHCKQKTKSMLLVVLSHIEEIATVVDVRFPEGEFDNYRKVVLKEPYRKMLEEGIL